MGKIGIKRLHYICLSNDPVCAAIEQNRSSARLVESNEFLGAREALGTRTKAPRSRSKSS